MTDPTNVVPFRRRETIPDNPIAVGNMLVEQEMTDREGRLTFAKHRDDILGFNGNRYVVREKDYIQKRLINMVDGRWTTTRAGLDIPFILKTGFLSIAIKTVEQKISEGLDHTKPLPQWRGGRNPFPDNDILVCTNGIVHLISGAIEPNTPDYINLYGTDYAFDIGAKDDLWDHQLRKGWEFADDAVSTIQQFYGLTTVYDTSYQKMLLDKGPTRSGKGVRTRVLAKINGNNSVIFASFKDLTGGFPFQDWIGARIVIFPDERISEKIDVQTAIGYLLRITGADGMSVKIKYAKKDVSTVLQVRVVIATNQALKLPDSASAVFARTIALEGKKSWLGQEDEDLGDKLCQRAPAILNWARQGLIDLRTPNTDGSRRKFIQPKCGFALINDMRKLSNHFFVFAEDQCIWGKQQTVYVDALYDVYCRWCQDQGIRPAFKVWFGIQLRDLGRDIIRIRSEKRRQTPLLYRR